MIDQDIVSEVMKNGTCGEVGESQPGSEKEIKPNEETGKDEKSVNDDDLFSDNTEISANVEYDEIKRDRDIPLPRSMEKSDKNTDELQGEIIFEQILAIIDSILTELKIDTASIDERKATAKLLASCTELKITQKAVIEMSGNNLMLIALSSYFGRRILASEKVRTMIMNTFRKKTKNTETVKTDGETN